MNEDTQPIDHPVSVDGRTAAEPEGPQPRPRMPQTPRRARFPKTR